MKLTRLHPLSDQSGFTIVEIMFVITIIGVLGAIAMVSYQIRIKQAYLITAYHELNLFRLPYQTLIDDGEGVRDFTPEGLNIPASTKYCHFTIKAPNLGSDTADAVVCNIQNLPNLQGESLSLTLTASGSWRCKASSGISASYLPPACRP